MDGVFLAQLGRPGIRGPARLRLSWWRLLPVAALLLPLALLGLAGCAGWRTAWRDAEGNVARTAGAAAEYAGRVLGSYAIALGRIEDLVGALPDEDIRAREVELHHAWRRMIAYLPQAEAGYVLDRAGIPLLSANILPVPRDRPVAADRDFFLALAGPAPPDLHVSRLHEGRIDGSTFFALSRRRTVAGQDAAEPARFNGVINLSIFPATLAAGLDSLLRGPEDRLTLIHADGFVLARTGPRPMRDPIDVPPLPPALERDVRSNIMSPNDGWPQVIARHRVAGFPVYVAARRPRAAILAEWWDGFAAVILFGAPATLALFLLSLQVARDRAALLRANRRLDDALSETAGWLERTTDGAGIGTWELDSRSGRFQCSARFHALWGVPLADGAPDRAALHRRVHPDDRAALDAMLAEAWVAGRSMCEIRLCDPGRGRPGEAAQAAWLGCEAQRIGEASLRGARLVGIVHDITARRRAEARTTQLLQRAVEQQEAERLRLARDLHDRLGQHLALLQMELARLAAAPAAAAIVRLQGMGHDIANEAHRLALELRPTAIDDLGLETALRQMLDDWSARSGIAAELQARLSPARPPMPVETTLYRVLQEALTNVVRHSGARSVGVILDGGARRIRMVVEDDGRGIAAAPRDAALPPPRGIANMRERLELVGGTLEIESASGNGTALLIEVPV